MVTQTMRPKWKKDTYYIQTSDGVYLRGNNSRLALKGKSLYKLLKHLIPHLDGTVTLEELTGGLDAARARMIIHLLEKLSTHHFLQDTSQDQPHTLRVPDLDMYAPGIAFIEAFQTSAAYRFERFCAQRLLLIGSRSSLTSLVQASLQCGARQISAIIAPEDQDQAEADFRQQLHTLLAETDMPEDERVLTLHSWEDEAEMRAHIQAYDAVLHIADSSTSDRAQLLNRLCREQQKTLIQAVLVDETAWIGPLVAPRTGICWECAWRRLQDNLAPLTSQFSYKASQEQRTARNHELTESQATILANRLLFSLFQHCTQAGPTEAAGKVIELDLTTLLSKDHVALSHPLCLACQQALEPTAEHFLSHIQRLQKQEAIDPDKLLQTLATRVDEQLGLFTEFERGDFVQVPLAIYQATLPRALCNEHQAEPVKVIGTSIDRVAARIETAHKASERYAAVLVDQRRLLNHAAAQQCSCPMITAEQLLETCPHTSGDEVRQAEGMWTWALDLQTQQAALVPASHVFTSPEQHTRGLASGNIWDEALCDALTDWCRELTIEQLANAHQPYPQVDLAQTLTTPEGTYLIRALQATGRCITVYEITGSLGVPTFAVCLDQKTVAYSSHCDIERALSLGLEQALQQCQSEQFQQPEYALAPVLDVPMHLRGDTVTVPRSTCPEAWSERQDWLLKQLQTNTFRAFAVPLDHDPALAETLPFIVRVLVGGSEEKHHA